MYNVSDNYKLAVADSHRKSKMRATIKIGTAVINIDDSDIIKDSVYVTNQCTNGNEYEYGCTYCAECGISIISAFDRYALYDAELRLYWSLWTGSEWEEIPLGVFYVSEPTRINDKISIKALDGMTKLDAYIAEDTQGTMPQLMQYIAEKCGVELAQTEEELATFVNADLQLSVQEDKVDSYRDLLAYMGMLTASFGIFDRYGKLKLVKYSTNTDVTLDKRHRFKNATFSDYTTHFTGLKARFIANENYAPYEVGDSKDGLVLDMGDIPLLRGVSEVKKTALKNVYEVLQNVSYTPFELETMGNPAIDLGDCVKNINVGRDNAEYISPVTYYYWTYRGKQKLRAVGGNPKLIGRQSLRDKYTKSLEGTIETKSVRVKEFRNADVIKFNSKATELARLNYSATEDSKPLVILSVRLTTDLDGILVVQFYTDGAIDNARTYRKYLERGEHFVTIADIYTVENNDRHTISVMANMEYFESDTRRQDADCKTHNNFLEAIKNAGATVSDNVVQFPTYEVAEIDTTVASATINKGEVVAILYGQGIAGEGKWDGTLNFTEEIKPVLFSGTLEFAGVNENVEIGQQVPVKSAFNEGVSSISFKSVFSFNANISEVIKRAYVLRDYVFNTNNADLYTFDKYIITNNDMFALKTIYKYESTEQVIDKGKMCSVALDYTGIDVESVVVENE